MEDNLHEANTEFEKLRKELGEATELLASSAQEKSHLEARIQERQRKNQQLFSQKKALQVSTYLHDKRLFYVALFLWPQSQVSKLEHEIKESEQRQKSSYSRALQAVKK